MTEIGIAVLLFFLGGLLGRATAPARPRIGLIAGAGLDVDRAVRRPELREAFREDRRRRR